MAREYHRVWEKDQDPYEGSRQFQNVPAAPPKPLATYTLLGTIAGVFVLQLLTLAMGGRLHDYIFVIQTDWYLRPWTLITSTLAHGGIYHMFFNGLFLYFFGPNIEAFIGPRRFFTFFFLTGAIAGIIQVHAALLAYGVDNGGLGASGALGGLLGIAVMLTPKAKAIIFPLPIPVSLWVLGLFFVGYNVLLGLDPNSRIGVFAHLGGLAVGLLYGMKLKEDLRKRGLRIVY